MRLKVQLRALRSFVPAETLAGIGIKKAAVLELDEVVVYGLVETLMSSSRDAYWYDRYLRHRSDPYASWRYRDGVSMKKAAQLLGIKVNDILLLRDKFRGKKWTRKEAAGVFAEFFHRHGRFPSYAELGPVNGLPTITMICRAHGVSPETSRGLGYGLCVRDTWRMGLLKPRDVLKIRNVTLRRDAVEHYGMALVLANAEQVGKVDPVHGRLVKIPPLEDTDDDFALYLEVVNSSPEPDGSYATYHLRVPPFMRTPHQARAWTFGVDVTSHNWGPLGADYRRFQLGQET